VNAASLQKVAQPPVAAAPAAQSGTVAGGGITPVGGQGFTPVASGGAQPAASGSPGVDPAQAIEAILKLLGNEYSAEPVIAADGTVYLERKPSLEGGTVSLAYVAVGKIDRSTGKMHVNPAIVEQAKAKAEASAGGGRELVKVGDQYVWQTTTEGPDGKPVISQVPATEEELKAYQQKVQAQQAQEAAKAKAADTGDWQQKMGTVASQMGLFGSVGQFVTSLSAGPNPYSGKPGASWMSGWFLAQRLNGKADGKLLPQWLTTGTTSKVIEAGLQAYGMLDMGNDIRVVRDFFAKAPPLPPVNPTAVQDLIKSGQHPAMAGALGQLGTELRDGTLQLVEGSTNAAVLNTKLGAAQLVQKSDLHQAWAATDPIKSSGLTAKNAVDVGVNRGLGLLKGLVQPAMMGATALGLASSVISLKGAVKQNGASVLVDTQQGRGMLINTISSAAFLGLYTLPMILPGLGMAAPAVAAALSATNIAANVLGGVEMLNRYGLFGKGDQGGFLDNDAVRAAFLIPPLTPIGAFAFFMKKRSDKKEAEAAKTEAAKQAAAAQFKAQRDAARAQLQAGGSIAGAATGKDGSIVVPTSVTVASLTGQAPGGSSGGSPPAASSGGTQQLTMTAKPMRY